MKPVFAASSLVTLLLVTVLSGCSSNGVKVDSRQLGTIQQGVTTEQQVIAQLGKPTSMTVTPERRILTYGYTQTNGVQRQAAASTASMVGGMMAGQLGALAGGLIGGNAVATEVKREQLTIEVDPVTRKVISYQHQRADYE
ncbi:MAG: hypothetical protein R3E95_23015 [Thiolinea sp.]